MGNKVTVNRPDGTQINVTPEEAKALGALGYKEQTPEQLTGQAAAESTEAFYSTPGQVVKTGAEGFLGGATLGLSDLAFDAAGFDTAERAGYNPGVRLGAEIVGGLAPLIPGAGALKLSPAGLLSEGALAAGKRLGGSKALQYGAAGVIEGAGVGAGTALTDSVVSGDPLTVESIAAGVGWGAIYGGGLGVLTGKAAQHLDARTAKAAATEATGRTLDEAWGGFRTSLDDISAQTRKAMTAAEEAVEGAKDNVKRAGRDFEQYKESVKFQNESTKARIAAENEANKAATKAKNEAEQAAIKAEEAAHKAQLRAEELAVKSENAANKEAVKQANEAKKAAFEAEKAAVKARNEANKLAIEEENKIAKFVQEDDAAMAVNQAEDIRKNFFNKMTLDGTENYVEGAAQEALKFNKVEGIKAFNEMKTALKSKNWKQLEKAQLRFQQHVDSINGVLDEASKRYPSMVPQDFRAKAPQYKPLDYQPKTFKPEVFDAKFTPETYTPRKFQKPEFTPRKFEPEQPSLKEFSPQGVQMMLPLEQMTLDQASKAFKTLSKLGATEAALRSMPRNVNDFMAMKPERAEKLFAAVDNFMGVQAAEVAGMKEGLKSSITALQEKLGLAVEGSPATQLRGIYEAVRGMPTPAAQKASQTGWFRSAVGSAGGRMASKGAAGLGTVGRGLAYGAGRNITLGLLGMKAAVVGGISKAALEWAPKVAVKGRKVGARIEPLATRLDGQEDTKAKSRTELMERRAKEIRDAAGSVRDTLYKNVMHLGEDHPDLGANLHAHAVKRYQFILDKLPKDPGFAFSHLKSLWRPDPVQTEKFARYYQVFQNPVGVINEILQTNRVHPEWAEGLREMDPALYQHARVLVLERLSDPAIMKKLDYPQQVQMGMFLGIPLHATMTPKFVATQQQMYMEKNQLIPMPPQPGAAGGGGRPSGPANSSGASSAQKITEH